uniref:phosphopantetheine-binding protein n=1 Tax=Paraburkholderia sp. BCC1885 TaxID=2562669 RepID=UPI001181D703
QVRAVLESKLPGYMVPSALMVLPALPLMPNGKLDRKALPEPEFVEQEYEAPVGEVEIALAGIWQDVLGLERAGRRANFFELGGDSILILKVVARAVKAGVTVTPRQLFETQTLAGLAQAVAGAQASKAPPLVAVPRDGPLPLSYAQQRLWFLWN